jgi:crotonobetainyl-CoA:carnitine CoA-transferase CaiB-like acyl-CoA transferase
MAQSLEGIKVVDFTQIIAGPAATRQLSLHGADVIKIESPGKGHAAGDVMRGLMAEGIFAEHQLSPIFQYLNTGKRSVVLDLKSEEGLKAARMLIESADVVVENFRPGVMARLGLDPADIRKTQPGLVWCAISGYGQTGPKSGLAAYDGPLQADTGIMSVNGTADGEPTRLGIMAIDMFVGANAATAIFSALMRRLKTGEGQFIDISMLDGALHLMAPQVLNFCNGGHVPQRTGNHTAAGLPTDALFPTATDPLLITAISEDQVRSLWEILERQDLISDARSANGPARMQNKTFVETAIAEALAADSAENWEQKIRVAGIPCARVRSVPEVVADPQVAAGDRLIPVPLPTGIQGDAATILGGGYQADKDGPASRAAPLYGADTIDVLREIELSAEEVQALIKNLPDA